MTLDGSFVLGAVIFAKLITSGCSPELAMLAAVGGGALAGLLVALIQRGGRVDPLLAGVLATFILSSLNLCILVRPNISLLQEITLTSAAFEKSEILGWLLTASYITCICGLVFWLMTTRIGLNLRALGDNPSLLSRLGNNIEMSRIGGFMMTNALAAVSGIFTAQTNGYVDVGMGFGMTLTGIGAIILGHQLFSRLRMKNSLRISGECIAALLGVLLYYFSLNTLLYLDIEPVYLKMLLGLLLIFFLRTGIKSKQPVTG